MLNFNYDINTIFIMLGQKCNLSCRYCMQHKLIETVQPQTRVNDDIIKFIINQAEKQSKAIDVRFYGGEPLLYFEDIKRIVEKLNTAALNFQSSPTANCFHETLSISLIKTNSTAWP